MRNASKSSPYWIFLLVVLVVACGKEPRIEGRVVDEANQPLAGVKVHIKTTDLNVQSAGDGTYSLSYVPGEFAVSYDKDGYIGTTLELKVTSKQVYPAMDMRLFRVPKNKAIYLLTASGYRQLGEVPIVRRTEQQGQYAFDSKYNNIFEPNGVPLPIESGPSVFLDFDPGSQTLIRLNERKEIGRVVTVTFGLIESASFSNVSEKCTRISEECWLHETILEPGFYAFVTFAEVQMGSRVPKGNCYYFQAIVRE